MKQNIFAQVEQTTGVYGTGLQAIPDTTNGAGEPAFKYSTAERQLTQVVCCGTLSDTFYVTAEVQLDDILNLSKNVSTEFICKLALYAKAVGKMRATSALLTTIVAVRDPALFKRNANDLLDFIALRTFCKIIRSGKLGRRSFGSSLRNAINAFLESRTEYEILMGNIGNDPSLGDIVKMTHPKPKAAPIAQLLNWIVKSKRVEDKHPSVKTLEEFTEYLNNLKQIQALDAKIIKNDFSKFTKVEQDIVNAALSSGDLDAAQRIIADKQSKAKEELEWSRNKVKVYKAEQGTELPLPTLPFEYLKTLPLSIAHWSRLVQRLTYNQLRKSIATIARTGVLDVSKNPDAQLVKDFIVNRLLHPTPQELTKFKPVDLLVTAVTINNNKVDIGKDITNGSAWINNVIEALYYVVELSLENAPILKGKTLIAVDCSGSMHSKVASNGKVESTLTRLDASSLLGVGLWRSNPDADFVTYGSDIRDFGQMYSSRDTFKTITQQIRLLNQGCTNTYMVFQYAYHKLATEKVVYDNIVIISDNESWSLAHSRGNYSHLLQAANDLAIHYKESDIKAPKVFNVDVDPTTCSHLPSSPNTFTIGGMGDYVYDLIKAYSETDTPSIDYWVDSVNKVIIK